MSAVSDGAVTPFKGARAHGQVGRWIVGLLALAFGLATLFEGGHVLFGGPEARAAAGNVVPFVLLFNFSAGFFYLLAGVGTLLDKAWAVFLARVLAATTLVVFVALGVHIAGGGAFEQKTVAAMTLRSTFWIVQSLVLAKVVGRGRRSP